MKDIEKIYNAYAKLIKNYILMKTSDVDIAEEIMQETFVVAIKQIDKFRGECDISTWLCSIAKNILYKKLKKNPLNNCIDITELELSDGTSLEEEIIKNNDKLKLYETLQNLDAMTREVMYLRLTGELTFKEIGQILHKSENWAKVTFFRGKQKLYKEEFYGKGRL